MGDRIGEESGKVLERASSLVKGADPPRWR